MKHNSSSFNDITPYATLEEVYGVKTFTKPIQNTPRDVVNSLRNANLQLRSEPLITKKIVSIFNNSTIEPMELPNLDTIKELPNNINLDMILNNLENKSESDEESSFENVQDQVLDWNLEELPDNINYVQG